MTIGLLGSISSEQANKAWHILVWVTRHQQVPRGSHVDQQIGPPKPCVTLYQLRGRLGICNECISHSEYSESRKSGGKF